MCVIKSYGEKLWGIANARKGKETANYIEMITEEEKNTTGRESPKQIKTLVLSPRRKFAAMRRQWPKEIV